MLTRGRRVHNGNVVVQQPLSAGSVISAACVNVSVAYIVISCWPKSWLMASFVTFDDNWGKYSVQAKNFFCILYFDS